MALQMCNICLGRYPAGEGNTRPGACGILAEELPVLSLGAGTTHEPLEAGGAPSAPSWVTGGGWSHAGPAGWLCPLYLLVDV